MDVKRFVKIGRPGYKGEQTCFLRVKNRSLFSPLTVVTKQRDPDTGQHSLFFQVYYMQLVRELT